jgi:hypothetical protein
MNRLSTNEFLYHFPQCVFCGGRSASVERDHQPGRNLFDQRIWPEGPELTIGHQAQEPRKQTPNNTYKSSSLS